MKEDRIAGFIERILRQGLSRLDDLPRLLAGAGRIISRKGRVILLNAQGKALIKDLIDDLRTETAATQRLALSDVDDEVVSTVFAALDSPSQCRRHARKLVERLSSGQEEWTVVWPISGLEMAPDEKLNIAGFSIGRLSQAELASIKEGTEASGSRAFLVDDPKPGSGGDHIRSSAQRALDSCECWAVGSVTARQNSAEMMVREEVSVACDVLRSFALYVSIDPDDTYLGLPHSNEVMSGLIYVPGGAFLGPNSRMDRRQPFILAKDHIEQLRSFDLFQRACEIIGRETLTRMEEQVQLAIVQFGLSSRLERSGARLVNYLTVLETVLGGEKGAHKAATMGQRLGLFFEPEDRAFISERIEQLYALRQRHGHHGQTSLRGRVVIGDDDISGARFYAYLSLLFGLRATRRFTNSRKSHKEFIAALDKEPADSRGFVLEAANDLEG